MPLKKKFAVLGLSLAPLLLSGCGDAEEYVHKSIDPDALCYSVKDAKNGVPAPQKLVALNDLLSRTPLTQDFHKAASHEALTFCETNMARIQYDAQKNLLLVGRDTGPEDILATRLYHLMTQKVNKKHWSAKLTPEEGLYFARILDAHALVSFTSDVHKEYRDTPLVFDSLKTMASADIRATLSSFEDTYNAMHDYREAQKSAFLAALQHRGKDAKRDQEFFKWYGTQLEAKTDLSISLCVDFSSGNLGPCFITQDTAPSNDMGQSVLGAETLMNISASHHSGGAYITAREAEEILQTMRSQEVVHGQKMLAGLHTELKKCCDGSRNNSLIGLGVLRGRFGLSLF